MAGMTDLPIDVMITILLRFTAKPLMQFKTVCKSWYHLISDPRFSRLHLDETLRQSSSNLRFIFSAPHLSSAEFDTFDHITELDHPFRKVGQGFVDVVGSCHGLICLYGYDPRLSILLYNPTTRTHKKLPLLPKPPNFAGNINFGFGYDSASGDYKFVRVLQSDEGRRPFWSQVMVYSSRADSWMRVQGVPKPFYSRRSDGVLVDGTLHWVHQVYDGVEKHYSVVSFRLSDHIFSEVPQPDYNKEEFINLSVGVLDECLCLLSNDLDDSDIWVMKEYGVVGSWTRLFRVRRPQTLAFFEWPIAYSRNRKELLIQLNIWRVVSLDLETMVVREVKVCDFSKCFDTHVCVENLMMLKDAGDEIPRSDQPCGVKRRRWRRRRQRRRKKRCFETESCAENSFMMLKDAGGEIPGTNHQRGKKRRRLRHRQKRRNKRCLDTDGCTENFVMPNNAGGEIPETNHRRGKKRRGWRRRRQQRRNTRDSENQDK